jgi:hypothetical protein
MWPETLLLAPYVAIASGILLSIAIGVLCWSRASRPGGSRRSTASMLQESWSAVVGTRRSQPDVIVHDPDLSKPHDLDDPFFDKEVRERVGATIADAARKK